MTARSDKHPRTAPGARFNRLAHGLRSAAVVIPDLESQAEWERFAAEIIRSLAPEASIEAALAARIAETLWRMRRIARAEQEFVVTSHRRLDAMDLRRELSATYAVAADAEPAENPTRSFYASALAAARAAPDPNPYQILPDDAELDKLIRYEAHLGRQLYHALHELEAIQERRRGNAAPLARVNVHGLPGT